MLGPVAGGVASRVASDILKPKEISNTLIIGAMAHAASAYAFAHLSGEARDPGWRSFTRGALWGEGTSAAMLAAGGIVLKTESGKKLLSDSAEQARSTPMLASNPNLQPTAPAGLLGLLTMARKSGYP